MSLSGSATVANAGSHGGLEINGRFNVDHALFDLPEQAAPEPSDNVVVRPDSTVRGERQPGVTNTNKSIGPYAPRTNVDINLGRGFRFRGQGADYPLRAVGNVRVTEGSTQAAFGRKLGIGNGFFTFNGPVANPGINILAVRRNHEVEGGVQVTGTDQHNNLGRQSTMTTALALLGSASGKRIAQTFGLDEFSMGHCEVGLTDPQVVMVSKAINECPVIGYELGLQ